MDSWQPNQADQQPASRRYNSGNILPQVNTSPQHPRDYASQQSQTQQPPAHSSAQGYQTYHGQAGNTSAVTTQAPRLEKSADYMDIQMQDADSYSRTKYQPHQPQQQQSQSQLPPVSTAQSRQSFLGADDPSTAPRYSPMNTNMSPQQPQYTPANSAYTPSTTTSQPTNFPYQQHRQSPSTSRTNYTNASQSYYSQQNSGAPSRPPPASSQSYHTLQQHQSTSLPSSGL